MRTKAGISGIPLSPTLTPSMRAGPENMEGRSPCRENNDSLPIQIPRCETHFVQFKEEKLIQFIYLFEGGGDLMEDLPYTIPSWNDILSK